MRRNIGLFGVSLAAAAALAMSGAGNRGMVIGGGPYIAATPSPGIVADRSDKRLTRKQIERRNRKARRRAAAHRKPRKTRYADPFQMAVNRLTNWQRKRWAGAGYPGLLSKDEVLVAPFAEMRRPAWI